MLYADVLKLVDGTDSKSVGFIPMWVQVPPSAPSFMNKYSFRVLFFYAVELESKVVEFDVLS